MELNTRSAPRGNLAGLLSVLLTCGACYNADALVQQRRDAVKLMQLEEVDLGAYRITMPPSPGSSTHGVVEFEAFGHVANRDRKRVEKSIEARGPELRHEMLLAVRRLSIKELEDADLKDLRQLIEAVVNEPLGEELVQRVGFHKFRFLPL